MTPEDEIARLRQEVGTLAGMLYRNPPVTPEQLRRLYAAGYLAGRSSATRHPNLTPEAIETEAHATFDAIHAHWQTIRGGDR